MKCPRCKGEMERKGSFPSGLTNEESEDEYATLYQCPNCKNVEIEGAS
jgi:phage FluMu protein Com